MGKNHSKKFTLLALASMAGLLTGACDGLVNSGDQPPGTTETFVIQQITLRGSTQENAEVTISNLEDQDSQNDKLWSFGFVLEGCAAPNCLASDTGKQQDYVFQVKATQSTDKQVHHKRVSLRLY